MHSDTIAGYDFGAVARSPVTMADFALMKAAAGFGPEDVAALARAGRLLAGREEALVDRWRARIGAQPALAAVFVAPDGNPDEAYKARVKARFVQWVGDTLSRPFDQDWLDYQHEIGRRHTPVAKNRADDMRTPPVVPLRYLIDFAPFIFEGFELALAEAGGAADDLQGMAAAWRKAVSLTLALWSRAYVADDLW